MTSSVYVAGVGMIPFVKPGANAPYPVMGSEATGRALADAGVSYDMIQQAYVGFGGYEVQSELEERNGVDEVTAI